MKNKLLQLLNIRSEESSLVLNLFWFQFFQGAGVAIFNTAALTLFLEHFDVLELPKVYLFSALLLWVAGFVYSKIEHALSIKKLIPIVIIFVSTSIFAFRAGYGAGSSAWYLFLMFSWFYVIYLLTNLEFWGLASLQFDIRQSKRLFGMIGAGDIPAKLIGYSAVPLIIKYLSSENMLIVAGVSILCSLIFYFRLRKAGKMDMVVKHEHNHSHNHNNPKGHVTVSLPDMVKSFFGNRMISYVASLSFIVVSCVTIISFSFYAEVKQHAHSSKQLEDFIIIFFTSGRVLAIIIRLIFTGRLMSILGTRGSLLISPIILFSFLLVIIATPFFTHDNFYIIYLFGLMGILSDVLKTSLQDPVFLSLMQPLSSQLRLRGHTIVKGVMDPFALAFSGFMLLSFIQISHKVDLFQLAYLLLILLIVWVVMIFVVDREYVRTLVTALDKRYSVGQEIDLTDEKTRKVLMEKMSGGERGEAIYILNLIEKQYSDEHEQLVIQALGHPKPEVKMEAIKLAERKRIMAALPQIDEIVSKRNDPVLLPEAVKAKCMLLPDELETLDVFVDDKDHLLMKSAIVGLMTSGGISAMVTAGQRLLQLIASPHVAERKMAAEIIGELEVQSFYKPLLDLMKDENEEVVRTAIFASGRVKNERLVQPMMQMFLHRKYEKLVVDALHSAGDVSLKEIKNALTHDHLPRQQKAKLILLCGRIGTDGANHILDELVWKLPSLRSDIFHALHLCEFKSQPHNREQHIVLMKQYIHAGVKTLFMLRCLEGNKTSKILADALLLELNEIRDSLLLLFSFVYDKEKMMKAKNAFQLKKKESVANALEIIEIAVPKEISLDFIKIFEPATVSEKCITLRDHFKEEMNYDHIMEVILNDKGHHFHRWTKAAALHSLIFYNGKEKRRWLEKAGKENDTLLKETSEKILAELN